VADVFMRAMLAAVLAAGACFGQAARRYFTELYEAGGLDRMADEYVCFADKPDLETFFIFGETKHLRQYMIENGTLTKLPKAGQAELRKDSLLFRGYDKGVPLPTEDILYPAGSSWVSEKFNIQKTRARIRFSISWQTLRYKRAVELLNPDGSIRDQVPVYGRCERITVGVQQHGK